MGIVIPTTAHRTSAARLQDRSLSAWDNNPYRGSSGPCCPVSSLTSYLDATRRSSNLPADTPLFKFTSGTPLTRAVFTQHIQRALTETGFANSSRFMRHSFRIGATTTATEVGVPAWLIKTMGRWSSDAYQQYIRTPLATQLAAGYKLSS